MTPEEPISDRTALSFGGIYGMEAKLTTIAKLHHKVTRWTNTATEEYTSYNSREEAVAAYEALRDELDPTRDREVPTGEIDSFDLCEECSRLISAEMRENGIDEWSISQGHWPCATATALLS